MSNFKRQWWPNIECWLGNFVIFQGTRISIAKKPFISVIFQGGGGGGGGGGVGGGSGPPVPPLDLHMLSKKSILVIEPLTSSSFFLISA